METSNYQTTNQNIFKTAINLADNKNYQELQPTDNYLICDHLIINHKSKQFFFTKAATTSHINKLIELKN